MNRSREGLERLWICEEKRDMGRDNGITEPLGSNCHTYEKAGAKKGDVVE